MLMFWPCCWFCFLPQILLTSKGISLNPITSLYYISPTCFVFLLAPWLFNGTRPWRDREGVF